MAFVPVARVTRSRASDQLSEMAAMFNAMEVLTGTGSSKRLNRWNSWWGNACIAAY